MHLCSIVALSAIHLLVPNIAAARPSLAVAPLDGDSADMIGDALIDALDDDAEIVRPAEVARAMQALGLSGTLDPAQVERLRRTLRADAVVQGRVSTTGGRK